MIIHERSKTIDTLQLSVVHHEKLGHTLNGRVFYHQLFAASLILNPLVGGTVDNQED